MRRKSTIIVENVDERNPQDVIDSSVIKDWLYYKLQAFNSIEEGKEDFNVIVQEEIT